MDILDYAMQMELDGKAFYERSAALMPQPELKKILLNLAEEEQKHFLFFKQLKAGETELAAREISPSPLAIVASKNLFQQLAEQGKHTSFGDQARQVWTEALKIEEKAEKMYREEAARESDPDLRALLTRIADEEQTHVYLVDNMLAFMSDPGGFAQSQGYKSFMSWEGR